MKSSHFMLLLAALFMAACNDDDTAKTPDKVLSYDGDNFSGPLLAAGEHELAVHFPASKMADYVGKKLTEVEFFVGQPLPKVCKLRVYKGGSSVPGTQVYEVVLTSGLQTLKWNKHLLAPPVDLNGEDLWLGVFVEHEVEQQSIGCDAGPRKNGGDWLFQSADQAWKTYVDRTGESVNWNIRGTTK